MKNWTKILVAASCVFYIGCSKSDIKKPSETIIIEGCEYLVIENGTTAMSNYSIAITHKGNCSNPIHIYNKVK